MKQNCQRCDGIGFLAHINDIYVSYKSIPKDIGSPMFVHCPDCHQLLSKESIEIPPVYQLCHFDTYNLQYITDSQRYVYICLQQYIQQKELPKKGFIITGAPGTGKSHLVVSVIYTYIQRGYSALYISEDQLVAYIRRYSKSYTEETLVQQFVKYQIIGISRIGSVTSSWDRQIISSFLVTLYEQQKWLVLLTSVYNDVSDPTLQERLECNDGYIGMYSKIRLLCPDIYTVSGEDYRERLRV